MTLSIAHKPTATVRTPSQKKDWHREEIKCAIRLKGYSIASLSRSHGLAAGTLANALVRPWPKGENIIAALLELDPAEIWPSRYAARKGKKGPPAQVTLPVLHQGGK